jgi:hypothetical protein
MDMTILQTYGTSDTYFLHVSLSQLQYLSVIYRDIFEVMPIAIDPRGDRSSPRETLPFMAEPLPSQFAPFSANRFDFFSLISILL